MIVEEENGRAEEKGKQHCPPSAEAAKTVAYGGNSMVKRGSSMSYMSEFITVDAIIQSGATTLAVDAFALSLIKAERQIRKLLSGLVFQFPAFDKDDAKGLRDTLSQSKDVYFDGCLKGWDALYTRSIEDMVGSEYKQLMVRLSEAIQYRNKIFHGQLTEKGLRREDLLGYVKSIRTWCSTLADSALDEIGRDGFERNSFQKSKDSTKICERLKVKIESLDEYAEFIRAQYGEASVLHQERCVGK